MDEQNVENEANASTPGNEKITYTKLGFRSAEKSKSNPDALDGYLEIVYNQFLEEQKLDEKGLKDRISKLKADVLKDKARKQEAIAEISALKSDKEFKEKDISELEIEKIDIRNGEGETENITPFVIASLITILLTLYLFVFYSSSGYSAFYGIKQGSLGFINPNVFAEASNKGGGVIALIILFPVIFLGLGFLIHDALEKNKKLAKNNKPPQYLLILSLLFITLIADSFIGYKISEGIQKNEFNAGRADDLWKFDMIFSDINFYLVLILGFVVYVIWGFLLHFVLSHPYLATESEKIKLMIEHVNNRISDKRRDLADIISKISKLEGELITIENSVANKQSDIIGYENGVIPINTSSLKSSIGEFLGGWQNYTHGNLAGEDATRLIDIALQKKETWLQRKIESLRNEN
jgi:hypothetical protein